MGNKSKQGGVSLIGFLVLLSIVGVSAFIAIRLFPMYSEFYSVKSAVKSLAADPEAGAMDPPTMKTMLFRKLDISFSDSVKPENVKIERADNGWNMHIYYERRQPLIGNLDVVGKFDVQQAIRKGGGVE